jgi:predicted SAM-dependent methyltransferase
MAKHKNKPSKKPIQQPTPAACPCGSAKPFAECHGAATPAPIMPTLAGPVITRKLDLAGGQNPREGFECVDRWSGAQHVVNLFKFPWPFEDSSVAELNCSHFLEHIPMIEVDHDGNPVPYGEGVDLMFRFFDECHRIIVPDGWMTCVVPNGRSNRGFQDPTHRRFFVAETFLYLAAEWRKMNKLDHYGVKSDWAVNAVPTVPNEFNALAPEVQQRRMNHEWNVVIDWVAQLRAIKPGSSTAPIVPPPLGGTLPTSAPR